MGVWWGAVGRRVVVKRGKWFVLLWRVRRQ